MCAAIASPARRVRVISPAVGAWLQTVCRWPAVTPSRGAAREPQLSIADVTPEPSVSLELIEERARVGRGRALGTNAARAGAHTLLATSRAPDHRLMWEGRHETHRLSRAHSQAEGTAGPLDRR